VEFFFRLVAQDQVDLRAFARCRFGVIGRETGRALQAHGFTPDLCPQEFTSAALAEALVQAVSPQEEAWLLQAQSGSDAVQKALGSQCRLFPLYATHHDPVVPGEAPDYLLFGSAGGVHALAETGYVLSPETTPLCIGPVAAQACRERFARTPLVPPEATAEAMVSLLTHDHDTQ
jgi:uroporphyrinogen-III synthase